MQGRTMTTLPHHIAPVMLVDTAATRDLTPPQRHELFKKRLVQVKHARMFPEHSCDFVFCAKVQVLLDHTATCADEDCTTLRHLSSRRMLGHCYKCRNVQCCACTAIRTIRVGHPRHLSSMQRDSTEWISESSCHIASGIHVPQQTRINQRSLFQMPASLTSVTVAVAPSETAMPMVTPSIPTPEARRAQFRTRLVQIKHARTCPDYACDESYCASAKELLGHMADCSHENCPRPLCLSTRQMLLHCYLCRNMQCCVCCAIRATAA
ncbi:Aste57867_19797 [Aphanomyces stellatus]|uniref:histone acetyltransferase n=1 Tax=Aphanomyces stellatus TaxID=120398 RepID=A0A485LFA4_9STRA|nr:hypothetical protein As57867_019732 [Aphanomyces stellatus]VFT96495.1 Aste57867_19797 [Aphanomyces stellatus]